jgi:hypothetical protein
MSFADSSRRPSVVLTGSRPEVARCDTIEVGKAVVRAGSKIEACNQIEQALVGAIRDRDRQGFLVKSFDVAADEVTQQPACSPLLGFVRAQSCEFLLEDPEGPQAVVLLQKPRMQVVHVSLFQIMEEATDLYSRPRLCSRVNFAFLRRGLRSPPLTIATDWALAIKSAPAASIRKRNVT